jgi:3-hydroxyacyl-CoA dehydrogenase / enoyl-CoA hydratase / 3-hydroxybutyryl-CoA epimerase
VLMPYLNEAMFAAQDGVPMPLVDRAAVDIGIPMGPVELADVIGLDVASHVGEIVARELGRAPPDLTQLRALVAAKKLGRKTGEGFYVWRDSKAVKPQLGGERPPEDLTDRLILPLVNECVACLRERVVDDPDLVDAAVIFGTGFAPFRGGPLQYARERGFRSVVSRLEQLAQRYGSRFQPDAGWSRLMTEGKA